MDISAGKEKEFSRNKFSCGTGYCCLRPKLTLLSARPAFAASAALWRPSLVGKGICGLLSVAGWSDLMRSETSMDPVSVLETITEEEEGKEDPVESFARAGAEYPNRRIMVARAVAVAADNDD